jgi:molybdopterin converting factor small subunit
MPARIDARARPRAGRSARRLPADRDLPAPFINEDSTMPVVRIPTPLRPHAGGVDRLDAVGSTVGEILDQLTAQHPALRERLFDGDELRRFVNVYVNNEDIRYLEDLATPVAANDEVSIIPAVAGG